MTHNEAVILSAYTGFMLVENFSDVHKFCEELLGRPIFTSEYANDLVMGEIRGKCKPLIIEMQKPKTNYDRIRNMSVEEMAKALNKRSIGNVDCEKFCAYTKDGRCNKFENDGKGSCVDGIKLWLESEVEE